jgi:hypothetical protein
LRNIAQFAAAVAGWDLLQGRRSLASIKRGEGGSTGHCNVTCAARRPGRKGRLYVLLDADCARSGALARKGSRLIGIFVEFGALHQTVPTHAASLAVP